MPSFGARSSSITTGMIAIRQIPNSQKQSSQVITYACFSGRNVLITVSEEESRMTAMAINGQLLTFHFSRDHLDFDLG
ncbi:hypothetical protein [Bradyrhizobium sp. ORS 285]|uniref:hypothetical protein n=2 Tax=Bradyrhizobium sp. ORS 285 TaxID=115808 RepID=UPI00055983D9|nr:hypothetical protein [Bradyrhizobium sp. ORS 285]